MKRIIAGKKECSKCGEKKLVSEFDKDHRNKSGITSLCSVCRTEKNKKYNKDNPEKGRERNRRWRRNNPEKIKALRIKNISLYPGKALAATRKWYADNIEVARKKSREATQAYIQAHPDRVKENDFIKRQRRRGVEGTITLQQWDEMKKFYNNTCLCCGKQEPQIELTIDHVIPIKLGGSNTIDNAQCLCRSCNSSKGARRTTDYR